MVLLQFRKLNINLVVIKAPFSLYQPGTQIEENIPRMSTKGHIISNKAAGDQDQVETPPGCKTNLQVQTWDPGVDIHRHDFIIFCKLHLLAKKKNASFVSCFSSVVAWKETDAEKRMSWWVLVQSFRSAGNYTHQSAHSTHPDCKLQ